MPDPQIIKIIVPASPAIVRVVELGPQGPKGDTGDVTPELQQARDDAVAAAAVAVPAAATATAQAGIAATQRAAAETARQGSEDAANVSTTQAGLSADARVGAEAARDIAITKADEASTSAANAALSGAISRESWAALALVVPGFVGQRATVSTDDAGTHTGRTAASPGADVGSVPNSGIYGGYALTVGAWRRDGAVSPIGAATTPDTIAGIGDGTFVSPEKDKAALDERMTGVTFAASTNPDAPGLVDILAGTEHVGSILKDGRFKLALSNEGTAPLSYPVAQGWIADRTLVCWGDSMTSGLMGVTGANSLASKLGWTVIHKGRGSQPSGAISARGGGKPLVVSVAGDEVPTSGSVALTAISDDVYNNSGIWSANSGSLGTCFIKGYPDDKLYLTSTGPAANQYILTRLQSGTTIPCPPGSIIQFDEAFAYRGACALLWPGHNNIGSGQQVLDDTCGMIDFLSPWIKEFMVLTLVNDNYNDAGANLMFKKYIAPDMLLDIRQHILDFGLSDCGLPELPADTDALALNNVPPSLKADTIHLTAQCQEFCVIPKVYYTMRSRGWLRSPE